MRDAFAAAIINLAAQDERVCLLVGDLGFRLWDEFRERFPGRFYNCGIAEANMVSMAAGLALSGLRPFCYSIASFATYRCYEQIRIDLCYHNLPVVIVGVGAGLSYANLGPTHHACEDIAVMRALPNMTIVAPCDPDGVRTAVSMLAEQMTGPAYLRLGKRGEPNLKRQGPTCLLRGLDVCLNVTGPIASVAMEAAKILSGHGISARVEDWFILKPFHAERIAMDRTLYKLVCTIEEHSINGGLGTAFAECRADWGVVAPRLLRFGTPDTFLHNVGNHAEALAHCGLTEEKIAERILKELK